MVFPSTYTQYRHPETRLQSSDNFPPLTGWGTEHALQPLHDSVSYEDPTESTKVGLLRG